MATSASTAAARVLSIIVIVAGAIMIIAGAVTWFTVQSQLKDEKITVSDDAERFAGKQVKGPFTAYTEANTIEKHTLAATGGKTYAELGRDDPARQTAMTGSFLRASLFTSVVAFGVAAMAAGLGVVFILLGVALLSLINALASPPRSAAS